MLAFLWWSHTLIFLCCSDFAHSQCFSFSFQINVLEVTIVIPKISHDDQRVKPLIEQLTDSLKVKRVKVDLLVKESSRITPQDGVMILPCIAVSRVESDINAVCQTVQLGKMKLRAYNFILMNQLDHLIYLKKDNTAERFLNQ